MFNQILCIKHKIIIYCRGASLNKLVIFSFFSSTFEIFTILQEFTKITILKHIIIDFHNLLTWSHLLSLTLFHSNTSGFVIAIRNKKRQAQ